MRHFAWGPGLRLSLCEPGQVNIKDGVRFRTRFDKERKPGSAARVELEEENFLQHF